MHQGPELLSPTLDEPDICEKLPDPFARAAEGLWRASLAPIPVGGEDGKKPLVTSFTKWRRRPGLSTIRSWIAKFPDANVGIVTGSLSGVSVIDVDSADLMVQRRMIDRFGDTPLKTRTPSGGCHLWYLHNEEASADFSPHIPVQLKAVGGFVVVPPSMRPGGPHAGHSYEFIEGALEDLTRLPPLKPGTIDRLTLAATNPRRLRAVKEGRRNNSLLRHLIHDAPYCDDLEALVDVGMTFGQYDCDPILPNAEIIKTANSVWKMKEEGRLWAKGVEPRVTVSRTVIDALSDNALKFYLKLRLLHFDRREFVLVPTAMAEAQVIWGWSHHKYRAARKEVLTEGFLKMVREGGSRPGDPSLFAFSAPPVVIGTRSVPNITIHPPPEGFPDMAGPQRERPIISLPWSTKDSSISSNIWANRRRGMLSMRLASAR
jgi:hypothetical protein